MENYTLDLPWSGDFSLDDRGRVNLVDGDLAYIHRLIRRLLNTPRMLDNQGVPFVQPDYIFHPTFGAGVRRMVNRLLSTVELNRILLAQIVADPETSKTVQPQIVISTDRTGVVDVQITTVRTPNVTLAFGFKLPIQIN